MKDWAGGAGRVGIRVERTHLAAAWIKYQCPVPAPRWFKSPPGDLNVQPMLKVLIRSHRILYVKLRSWKSSLRAAGSL